MLLPILLACEPDPLPQAGVTEPAGSTLGEPDPSVEDSAADAEAAPSGCASPIYVAAAGNSTADPVLATPHSLVFGAAPAPGRVRVFYGDDPSTSMNLLWTTDAATTASQVEFGFTDALGFVVDGASFPLGTTTDDIRVHEARLCGLAPGRTYRYRVGGGDSWSDTFAFTTAPEPGSAVPFTFGIAGDSRGSPSTWGTIATAMVAAGVDFIVYNGDSVTSGSAMSEWKSWLDAGNGYLEGTPLVQIMGNHENHHQNWYGFVTQPGNEVYFSFDYANAHFVVLTDTVVTTSQWQEQADWYAQDLAASGLPWKFALHHKAAYASSKQSGADANVKKYFVEVGEDGGVAVDFAGHAHRYERSVPLYYDTQVGAEAGTTYVVSGGAGAPLYTTTHDYWYTAVQADVNHYLIATVNGPTMSYTAYDTAGNVIDAFTTTR